MIESEPVRFLVVPPLGSRRAAILADIEGPESPRPTAILARPSPTAEAIRIAGLARLREAIEPLLRRLERDPSSAHAVSEAIARIGDAEAAHRALDQIALMSNEDMLRAGLFQDHYTPVADLIALAPDCSRLPWILSVVRTEQRPNWQNAIDGLDSRCPDLRIRLREFLRQQPAFDSPVRFQRTDQVRSSAITLLGLIGEASDVPLVGSILQEPLARSRLPGAYETTRRAAIRAVPRLGGPQAADWLVRVLGDPVNRDVQHELLVALEPFLTPALRAALFGVLETASSPLRASVITMIGRLGDPATIPELRAFLVHPEASTRTAAVQALSGFVTPDVLEDMQAIARRADSQDRILALEYLSKHGNSALMPVFMEYATASSDGLPDGVRRGIERFGTAADAAAIHAALRVAAEPAMYSLSDTLRRLTFASDDNAYGLTVTYVGTNGDGLTSVGGEWERWLRRRAGRTRAQWAEEAIDRAAPDPYTWWERPTSATGAVQYLASLPASPIHTLRRAAATSGSWRVRVASARALAATDRSYAIRLLVREFDNRSVGACWMAVRALEGVTGAMREVQCLDPLARREAAGFFLSFAS